jgi:hypothetical protein
MDAEQFDSVAKALGQSNSRRGVVRTLTGAVVGGLLVAVGVGEAGAKKKNKKKKHDNGRRGVKAQGNPCKKGGVPCGKGKNACCTGGKTCQRGLCVTTACAPNCTGKCGGASDGCSGTCDAACPGTCSPACSYPTSCRTSVDGMSFCSSGGYCRPCTSDAGCVVLSDPTAVYYCVEQGFDLCGQGYTTTCMAPS